MHLAYLGRTLSVLNLAVASGLLAAQQYPIYGTQSVDMNAPIYQGGTVVPNGANASPAYRYEGGTPQNRIQSVTRMYDVIEHPSGQVVATQLPEDQAMEWQDRRGDAEADSHGVYTIVTYRLVLVGTDYLTLVEKDGYQIQGTATLQRTKYQLGAQLASAQIAPWNAAHISPWIDPSRPWEAAVSGWAVNHSYTFWWPNLANTTNPWGGYKTYYIRPTYRHGSNSNTEFYTFFGRNPDWVGWPPEHSFEYLADKLTGNSHNEGGLDHRDWVLAQGLPTRPYVAGCLGLFTGDNHSWWPSGNGKAELASVELAEGSPSTSYAWTYAYTSDCLEQSSDGDHALLEIPGYQAMRAAGEVIDGVISAEPPTMRRYTRVSEEHIYVPADARERGNQTPQAYLAAEYGNLQKKAAPNGWPEFASTEAKFDLIGDRGVISVQVQLKR